MKLRLWKINLRLALKRQSQGFGIPFVLSKDAIHQVSREMLESSFCDALRIKVVFLVQNFLILVAQFMDNSLFVI